MRKTAVALILLLAIVMVFGALGCTKTVYVTPTPTPMPTLTLTPTPTPVVTPTPSQSPTPTQIVPTTPTTTLSPVDSIKIYLDPNYTQEWDTTNLPDLDSVLWSPKTEEGSPYEWETGNLTVYLKNIGSTGLKVNASATEGPGIAVPCWGVESDTVILRPNERSPMIVTLTRSTNCWYAPESRSIYFQIVRWAT